MYVPLKVKAPSSTSTPYLDRMIACELNLLLSKCRAASGSLAKEDLHGPLDFALWAYRDVKLVLLLVKYQRQSI